MIKANLSWSAAAKFYIFAAGLIATLVTAQTDLPDWVPPVVAVITAVAGWLKSQQPVTST